MNTQEENKIGEIVAKGPNVMLGYYNNENETNKVLKDGWFYTGDLGYMDDEEFLYISGRSKNMIHFEKIHLFIRSLSVIIRGFSLREKTLSLEKKSKFYYIGKK